MKMEKKWSGWFLVFLPFKVKSRSQLKPLRVTPPGQHTGSGPILAPSVMTCRDPSEGGVGWGVDPTKEMIMVFARRVQPVFF